MRDLYFYFSIRPLFLPDFSASLFGFLSKRGGREEGREFKWKPATNKGAAAALLFDKQIVSRLISFLLPASILRVLAPGRFMITRVTRQTVFSIRNKSLLSTGLKIVG